MKKKKSSRSQNAKAQEHSISKAAHSQDSAKKKSKKFKDDVENLRVAVPTDSRWRVLQQEGLIVPDELDPHDENVPLDFTQPSNRAIGAIHSRFAVRHSYALYSLAKIRSRLVRNRRELRHKQAIFRARHANDFKNKYSLDDAMENDATIRKLLDRIMKLEVDGELVEAVAAGYEVIRNAASREMSRRDSERASRD
jgi:hypothetical protein